MSTRIAAVPETFMFASRVDQAPIFVRKWLPPGGIRPRATVQITRGIAEHSGRYDRFARFLAATGAVVYAPDLRGHEKDSVHRDVAHWLTHILEVP